MSKKDEESVTKGMIKQFFKKYEREGAEFFLSKECFELIDALPTDPPRKALQATPSGQARPVAEIERRIEKIIYEIEAEHYGEPATFSGEEVIQILRAICGEENEWSKLFKDEELLGEPQLKAKAKGGSR